MVNLLKGEDTHAEIGCYRDIPFIFSFADIFTKSVIPFQTLGNR